MPDWDAKLRGALVRLEAVPGFIPQRRSTGLFGGFSLPETGEGPGPGGGQVVYAGRGPQDLFKRLAERRDWRGFGVGWTPETTEDAHHIGTITYSTRAVWGPTWALAVVFAALPAGRVVRWGWRRRRRRAGLCAACGYDLRATPERCPECGGVPGT